jgi:uncharacterized protein YerC
VRHAHIARLLESGKSKSAVAREVGLTRAAIGSIAECIRHSRRHWPADATADFDCLPDDESIAA